MSIHESTGKVVSWDDLCKSDGFTLLGITKGFSQGGRQAIWKSCQIGKWNSQSHHRTTKQEIFTDWTLEWVILGWFFHLTLLQAGICARHTKEQEKYRSYMFYVSIFQRFWTFVLYNYTLQLQGENGQNRPENPQNWNMTKIAPKSDKFTK